MSLSTPRILKLPGELYGYIGSFLEEGVNNLLCSSSVLYSLYGRMYSVRKLSLHSSKRFLNDPAVRDLIMSICEHPSAYLYLNLHGTDVSD